MLKQYTIVPLSILCMFINISFSFAQTKPSPWRGINPAKAITHFSEEHINTLTGGSILIEKSKSGDSNFVEVTTLYLGDDLILAKGAKTNIIYDFTHDLIAQLDIETNEFRPGSVYPGIFFRLFEVQNRSYLKQILAKTDATVSPNLKPVQFEAELGITGKNSNVEFEFTRENLTFEAHYQGDSVLKILWSETELSENELKQFWRYVRWNWPIHPKIFEQLKTEQRLPLVITLKALDYSSSEISITDQSFSLSVSNEGLTDLMEIPGLAFSKITFEEDVEIGSPKARLIQEILEAASTFEAEDRFAFEKHVNRGTELLNGPHPIDGILALLMAYTQELIRCSNKLGDVDFLVTCQKAQQGIRQITKYEEGGQLIRAIDSKTPPQEALIILGDLRSDNLEYNFWLGQFMANIIWPQDTTNWSWEGVATSDRDPVGLFTATFRADPTIPSYYKDLGDFYSSGSMVPASAWTLYDIGRSVSRMPLEGDLLSHITKKEFQLRAAFPDFFPVQ